MLLSNLLVKEDYNNGITQTVISGKFKVMLINIQRGERMKINWLYLHLKNLEK